MNMSVGAIEIDVTPEGERACLAMNLAMYTAQEGYGWPNKRAPIKTVSGPGTNGIKILTNLYNEGK